MFTIVLFALSVGCTYSHTAQKTHRALQMLDLKSAYRVQRQQQWAMAADSRVLVNYPQGPLAAPYALPRLRHSLAMPWLAQAGARFGHVAMAPMDVGLAELFRSARAGHYQFILQLVVLQTLADPDTELVDGAGAGGLAGSSVRLHGDHLLMTIEIFDTQTETRLDTLTVLSERPFWDWSTNVDEHLLGASLDALLWPLGGSAITFVR